jgi:hypothetical protein
VVLTLNNEEVTDQAVEQSQQSAVPPLAALPPRRGMSLRTQFTAMPAEQHGDRYYGRNNAGRGLANRIASVRQRDRADMDHYRSYEIDHLQHVDGEV